MGKAILTRRLNLNKPLGTFDNPALSAAELRSNNIIEDGGYWLDPENSGFPYLAYIRFNWLDGGDWELVLKVHNQGDMTSGNSLWLNQTLQNEEDMNLTSGNFSKYGGWNRRAFNRIAMEMWQSGEAKIPPIMIYNTQLSSMYSALQSTLPIVENTSGLLCNSTDPVLGNSRAYYNMPMKQGSNFININGAEEYINGYGIGIWANDSTNSTTAEGFSSVGRAGAWIGSALDNNTWSFNNFPNNGSDSGFGFGASGGNPAKTTSAGYAEWTISNSRNTLPAYLWIR